MDAKCLRDFSAVQGNIEGCNTVRTPAGSVLRGKYRRRQTPGQFIRLRTLQQSFATVLPLIDRGSGHRGPAKRGMVHQIGQKATVVAQPQQGRIAQRGAQAPYRVIPVSPMHDDLGHHRVVEGRDFAAFFDAVIDAHTIKSRLLWAPPAHGAGLRRKAGIGVFHVQAGLHGVAFQRDLALGHRQCLPCRHQQLPLDQIETGHQFGHRMLHLQPGVHFKKVVFQAGIHHELHRASTAIAHRQCGRHGVLAHGLAHRGTHYG